jgi:hypothetical protein
MTTKPNVNIASIKFDELTAEQLQPGGELTSTQLERVSGGRTNAQDPFVQVVLLAAKAAFYQGMFYADQGW